MTESRPGNCFHVPSGEHDNPNTQLTAGSGSARRARTLGARPCSATRWPSSCERIEENHAREWYPVEMIVRDWRDADAADTQLLYAREQDFWVRELAWDASNSWREIEQARTTWGLPGRIAIDHKRTVRGWSYYMPDGETLHIGGIAAETKDATAALARCVPRDVGCAAASAPRVVLRARSSRRVRDGARRAGLHLRALSLLVAHADATRRIRCCHSGGGLA